MSEQQQRPYIGGQAVIEGVMMRSPGSLSVVCRRKSGELVVRERPVAHETVGLRRLPFVRGVATVVESLRLGSAALRFSAELYEEDLRAEDEAEKTTAAKPPLLSALSIGLVALLTQTDGAEPLGLAPDKRSSALRFLPIVFAIGLLVALPQLVAEGVTRLFKLDLPVTSPAYQAITGCAKLAIVVSYLFLIRRVPEIRRVFQYHGAEHKAITTYESKEDLVVANARLKTTMHPRCGTTFLVMIALVSILAFTALGAVAPLVLPPSFFAGSAGAAPWGGRAVQGVVFFALKLPFLPVIAAVTYEIQRIFAKYCTTGPLRALLWPGFLVQKITTIEPDDAQLEVAMASLKATLWREAAVGAPAPADRTFDSYDTLLADPGYAAAAS
jgi:uncharacterized protein YqhQ